MCYITSRYWYVLLILELVIVGCGLVISDYGKVKYREANNVLPKGDSSYFIYRASYHKANIQVGILGKYITRFDIDIDIDIDYDLNLQYIKDKTTTEVVTLAFSALIR